MQNNNRNIYLQTVSISRAIETVKQALKHKLCLETEILAAHEAAGRITASPVYARYSSPTYHSAAMDGIAVKASSTFSAREDNPLLLKKNQDYLPVNTGYPLPQGMDAVIMIEHVQQISADQLSIEAPAYPWQHVRRIGEDIVATELLLPQNHHLGVYDIGALLSAGIWELRVWNQPHIHFIPTGDEVLDFAQHPSPGYGQVVESNSQILGSLAKNWGCTFSWQAPVPDNQEALTRELEKAMSSSAQVVVIGAGSSAGTKDFTRQVMQDFGKILVHGIAAMPGKPTILAQARDKLLIGAPGYPVSAVVCFEQVLEPLIAWMTRTEPKTRQEVKALLTRKVPSKLGVEEFLRLSVGRVKQGYVATPLGRGAGMISTMTKAQGFTRIKEQSEGLQPGQQINVELLVPEKRLSKVLVAVGSHDNTLDLVANELKGLESPLELASTHVGSMGGLMALKSGSAHLAGAHLFDPETNDFNFPFITRYLKEVDIQVVNLAIRQQGLIVARGNPLDIQGIQDLTRPELRFINRQRGSGTRILLDHHLQLAGINPDQIPGYKQEEFTHMAVAVNVSSSATDCGLGIYAAAKALDLDFIPLARERYDLLIPGDILNEHKLIILLELLRTQDFQKKIKELGGYETSLTGQIMQPGQGLQK